jgi:FMN phosphatase YigB (HAD superfamily)
VTLIVLDLVPALLTWEGRDTYEGRVAPEAREVLEDLYAGFRLAAVADGDRPASRVRETLEALGLADLFESITTSAGFGPAVTPRVVRRLAAGLGVPSDEVIVVTARKALAEGLDTSRMSVILTGGPEDFPTVPEAVAELVEGPLNP